MLISFLSLGSCSALPSSESEDVACRLNGQEVSCIDAEDNTTAIIQCKPFHTIFGNKLVYKCHNSKWDQSFTRCTVGNCILHVVLCFYYSAMLRI